jgi:hypothetical protein
MDTNKSQFQFEELTESEALQVEGGSFLAFLGVCFVATAAFAFIKTCCHTKQ